MKTITIVGGQGIIGSLFVRIFKKNKFRVNIIEKGKWKGYKKIIANSDIVLVSVPIKITDQIIKKVGPYLRKDAVLVDTTSLKEFSVKAMLKNSKSEVVGMHPLFGPGVKELKKQTIVLCPGRGKKWIKFIEKTLKKEKAVVKVCSAKRHDKIMSIVQGLNHFNILSTIHAMKGLDVNLDETLQFTSPVYKIRMEITGRILNQNPELYKNIQLLNDQNKKVAKALIKSTADLKKIIEKKDEKMFLKYFNDCARFFGKHKESSEKNSNKLIRLMVK